MPANALKFDTPDSQACACQSQPNAQFLSHSHVSVDQAFFQFALSNCSKERATDTMSAAGGLPALGFARAAAAEPSLGAAKPNQALASSKGSGAEKSWGVARRLT